MLHGIHVPDEVTGIKATYANDGNYNLYAVRAGRCPSCGTGVWAADWGNRWEAAGSISDSAVVSLCEQICEAGELDGIGPLLDRELRRAVPIYPHARQAIATCDCMTKKCLVPDAEWGGEAGMWYYGRPVPGERPPAFFLNRVHFGHDSSQDCLAGSCPDCGRIYFA